MDALKLEKVSYETVLTEIANEIKRDVATCQKTVEVLQKMLPTEAEQQEHVYVEQGAGLGFFVNDKYYVSIKRATLHLAVFLIDITALHGTAALIAGMTDSLKKCFWKIKPEWLCLMTEISLKKSPTVNNIKDMYMHETECFNRTETIICPYFSEGKCTLKSKTTINGLLDQLSNEEIIRILGMNIVINW